MISMFRTVSIGAKPLIFWGCAHGAVHMLHIKCCDSSRVVLLKPVGFPAVWPAKALGWGFWGVCYKQYLFTTGCDTRFFHHFPGDIESVHYLWPQRSCALNRRSLFQSGPRTIPDYYRCVCLGLLQQQAAGLLVHTSGASVSWAPVSLPLPTPPAVKCSISHQGVSGRLVLKWASSFWQQRFFQPGTVCRGCWGSPPVGGIATSIVCVGMLWLLFLTV